MQLYQFEKIYAQMEKENGKIKKGEEDAYAMILMPMEGNALKVHRENPAANSRRLREAIALVLFDIKEKCTGEKIDTGNFRNVENEALEKALLMAFDPITNEEVKEALDSMGRIEELTRDALKDYYKIPVMCLLRIKDSIDLWEKQAGANGYFEFIENFMGDKIQGTQMNYSVVSRVI